MTKETEHNHRLVVLFSRHKVAATLLMILILLTGVWALLTLNRQFLPRFGLNVVTVRVSWPGASPIDVERAITNPIEDSLSAIDDVKKTESVSSRGSSYISLEFKQNVVMSVALAEVKNKVDAVRNLPQDALNPTVRALPLFEQVAQVVITANDDVSALRYYANEFKRQLIDKGIARIGIKGLPKQQINVTLTPSHLAALQKSLIQLGEQIKARSQRISAGIVGEASGGRQLRTDQLKRTKSEFEQVPIAQGNSSMLMSLMHFASVGWYQGDNAKLAFYKGKPAINLVLYRSQSENALQSATVLHQWRRELQTVLPQGMQVHVYAEFWQLIKERINVLLKNGAGGLLLIFALLYLFLNTRAAFWVAAGIPISLAAAIFMLKLTGGTINMISLFALIMSLGIIVDDTIVVAEQAISEFQSGASAGDAVVMGAQKMMTPVLASSLTTVAAFSPLLLLGGIYGTILVAIPRVVICVIFASLVECFFILPYHLKRGLQHVSIARRNSLQSRFVASFEHFRDIYFRRFVQGAIKHCWLTLSIGFSSFIIILGLLAHGYVRFTFFPSPPSRSIYAEATFVSGTSTQNMKKELSRIEAAAWKTNDLLKAKEGNILKHVIAFTHNTARRGRSSLAESKVTKGALELELSSPADRRVTNKDFVRLWREQLHLNATVENLTISAVRAGPPGFDIDIGLFGADPIVLKRAAEDLKSELNKIKGVSDVVDNLPYAQSEYVFALKPSAQSLGLTTESVARQLQSAFTGHLVQLFHQNEGEVEVRLRLNQSVRNDLGSLERVPIRTPQGKMVALSAVATLKKVRGFDALQHVDRQLAVKVTAEVNSTIANANSIIAELKAGFLEKLQKKYGVRYAMKGVSRDQASTLKEMKYFVLLALSLIYIILAWVSSSYTWPLFVMLAIPLGLEGAIFGHLVLGRDLTLLSLFGFFALTGIVINDSIILLLRFKEIVSLDGQSFSSAIVEACCQRLRAVVLTSLSTIVGLLPLLFERSLQAQFLIPMAISIIFGLAFSTVLILVVIPAAIVAFESCKLWASRMRA